MKFTQQKLYTYVKHAKALWEYSNYDNVSSRQTFRFGANVSHIIGCYSILFCIVKKVLIQSIYTNLLHTFEMIYRNT